MNTKASGASLFKVWKKITLKIEPFNNPKKIFFHKILDETQTYYVHHHFSTLNALLDSFKNYNTGLISFVVVFSVVCSSKYSTYVKSYLPESLFFRNKF